MEEIENNLNVSSTVLNAVLVLQAAFIVVLQSVIPVWLLSICVLCLLWRGFLNYKKTYKINRWIVVLILAGVLSGVGVEFIRSGFSLSVNISLLTAMFVFKSLELNSRRDFILLVLLGFILLACVLLHSQSLLVSLFVLAMFIFLLSLLMVEHLPQPNNRLSDVFKRSCWLVVQSLPLCAVCLLFVPKLPPIWAVPAFQSGAKTGMSDSMQPGTIANLIRSDELVFRAHFNSAVPNNDSLYWRSLVLTDFDGSRWFVSPSFNPNEQPLLTKEKQQRLDAISNNVLSYQIVLEPQSNPWLFALTDPVSQDGNVVMNQSRGVYAHHLDNDRFHYSLLSVQDQPQQSLTEIELARFTAIPEESNLQSQSFAQRLLQQSNNNHEQMVQKILAYFNNSQFSYTLTPKPLDQRASVDDFLMNTKEGFCEFYSSAFVFLLRSVGIPARVVVGYQGGSVNKEDKLVTVRQYDAHAWAEWWSPKKGWIRVDPTAAVSPDRVELGAQQTLSQNSEFLANRFLAKHSQKFSWVKNLRMQWDTMNYQWTRLAVGFDEDKRQDILKKTLGDLSTASLIKGLVLSVLSIALFLWLSFYVSRRWSLTSRSVWWVKEYHDMQARIAIDIKPHHRRTLTPSEWARLVVQKYPILESSVNAYIQSFLNLQYSDVNGLSIHAYKQMKQQHKLHVNTLKKQLKSREYLSLRLPSVMRNYRHL